MHSLDNCKAANVTSMAVTVIEPYSYTSSEVGSLTNHTT